METEWYHLPERGEVMVNVTDLFGEDFNQALTEIEQEFKWTGAEFFVDDSTPGCEPERWMYLLGATELSTSSQTTPGSNDSERSKA